jgi:hypothetical protein
MQGDTQKDIGAFGFGMKIDGIKDMEHNKKGAF